MGMAGLNRFGNGLPACCPDWRTYDEWREAARLTKLDKAGFCTDCTLKYATRMRVLGRCLHPEIIFGTDEHGFMEGKFPTIAQLNEGAEPNERVGRQVHNPISGDIIIHQDPRKKRNRRPTWRERCEQALADRG